MVCTTWRLNGPVTAVIPAPKSLDKACWTTWACNLLPDSARSKCWWSKRQNDYCPEIRPRLYACGNAGSHSHRRNPGRAGPSRHATRQNEDRSDAVPEPDQTNCTRPANVHAGQPGLPAMAELGKSF